MRLITGLHARIQICRAKPGAGTNDPRRHGADIMIYRSEAWLAAVRSLPYCVLCGTAGVQAAHANIGKGMSIKADDAATAAICAEHHREIDHGTRLSNAERRAMLDRAIVLTVVELARRGLIGVAGENPRVQRRREVRRPSKGRTATSSKIIPHRGTL
jgi:hypothetical protein